MNNRRACVVMAFDAAMFFHARECIEHLLRYDAEGWSVSLVVLDLGLKEDEKAWLGRCGATLATNVDVVPNFPDAPGYMRAMTCRPYLRDMLPGYDVYMWMDADIRIVAPHAVKTYLDVADANRHSIAICQEVESTYGFVRIPQTSRNYHVAKHKRIAQVYGETIAELFDGFLCYNAGIFAMHRDSVIWKYYRANLERAMKTPFDHMKEQDAMNVALLQCDMAVCNLTPLYNWLCSASQPVFSQPAQRWVRPEPPREIVSVLHLAASNAHITGADGKTMTMLELYYKLGMTKCVSPVQ